MIELVMKDVLDKLIDLAKYREKRTQDRFDGLVKPLHQQMQKVHSDYVRMFEDAAAAVRGDASLTDATQQLWMARNLDRAIRHELFRHVHHLLSGLPADDELKPYLRGIIQYVETFGRFVSGTPATFIFGYLRHVAEGMPQGQAADSRLIAERREQVAQILSGVVAKLESNWVKVTDSYAALLAARYL